MSAKIKKLTSTEFKDYTGMFGEVIVVEEDDGNNKTMVYNDGWYEVKGEGLTFNLYDINKQIISQLPVLEFNEDVCDKVNELIKTTNNTFYLLYGREIGYFTLFQFVKDKQDSMIVALEDCLNNIGDLKSIEWNDTHTALEIWIDLLMHETICLYLFPYDSGLVEVN